MAKIPDQLQNTAIKVIHARVTDVLLNTVYEISNLYTEYADTEVYGEALSHKDMSDEIADVKNLFKGLKDALGKTLEERADYAAQIDDVRNRLLEKYRSVFAAKSLCSTLSKKSMHLTKLETIPDELKELIPPKNEELVDSVISRVARSYDIPYIVSMLLSAIPLRMARAKYDDLVQRSLEMLFMDMSNAFIDNCKFTFAAQLAPQSLDCYGKYFPLIAESLDELAKFDRSKADKEAVEEYNDMLDDTDDKLDNIELLLNICFNIVNYIDILNKYSIDEVYAYYDNLVIKDLYYSCMDMLDSDTPEIYADAIIEKSSDLIEELFNETRNFEDTLQDAIQALTPEAKSKLSDECKLALQVYNNIVFMFLLDIADGLTSHEESRLKPATIEEADAAIDDIIKMINEHCEGLATSEKKLVKQYFLSKIPIDISPNELHDYMIYAFEGITNENERLIAYGDVLEVLDQMDLLDPAEDEDEHEHHHHDHGHDCDCGCGHDHHHHDHDHGCDCGHDHHHHDHDHGCDCGHDHHHH